MKNTRKIGGISAIILTVIYIVGIVMNATMLDTSGIKDPVELIYFMKEHAGLMYSWITLLYVVFGIVLVFVYVTIYEVLREKDDYMAKIATSFGVIWSVLVIASGMVHNVGMTMAIDMLAVNPEKAGDLFTMINSIHIGLGGGNEIPGAIWTLLVSIIALKHHLFKKWVNITGIIVGIAGILTIVPSLFNSAVMVFALGQMVWWIGLGVLFVKEKN